MRVQQALEKGKSKPSSMKGRHSFVSCIRESSAFAYVGRLQKELINPHGQRGPTLTITWLETKTSTATGPRSVTAAIPEESRVS
jgi:hypothetical protein